MKPFLLGFAFCAFLALITYRISIRRPVIKDNPLAFADGVKLGYYMHSKGGTKADVNMAIAYWNNNQLLNFIQIFENDHPRTNP